MKTKRESWMTPKLMKSIRGEYSQEDMAQIFDVNVNTYAGWERGDHTIPYWAKEAMLILLRQRARREGFNVERWLREFREREYFEEREKELSD